MKTAAIVASLAAAALPSVYGHGYMITPKAALASGDPTRYAVDVRGSTILPVPAGGSFSNTPQINVDSFTKAFKASGLSSLKELITTKIPQAGECGITPPNGPAQPVPNAVVWSAFADSHVGPCEVWCDNVRVFQEDNCAGKYRSQPATLPIDSSKCQGAAKLRFYWLALHSQDWQVYINCAPLQGGTAGGNGGGNTAPTPALRTPAPAPKPNPAPAPQPNPAPAPQPNPAPAPQPNPAPAPKPNPAPAPKTSTPSAGNGGNAGGDADCDDDLPEPDCDDLPDPSDNAAGDADDCNDDLPEPDCDDNLPEPDCDDNLPEPDCDDLPEPETGNDAEVPTKDINFGLIKQRSADEDEDAPGQVYPEDY